MTHEQMVTVIMYGNFRSGDLVEITLTNGDTLLGRLSDAKVYGEKDENGEIINSRIGLLNSLLP